jgi:hypothetical protein
MPAFLPPPAGRWQKRDWTPYPVFGHYAVDHPASKENGEHANHVQRLFTGLKSAVSGGQCGNQRAFASVRSRLINLSIAFSL